MPHLERYAFHDSDDQVYEPVTVRLLPGPRQVEGRGGAHAAHLAGRHGLEGAPLTRGTAALHLDEGDRAAPPDDEVESPPLPPRPPLERKPTPPVEAEAGWSEGWGSWPHESLEVLTAEEVVSEEAADELITLRLRDALALVDIRVLDHLIVGDTRCVSLAERGVL